MQACHASNWHCRERQRSKEEIESVPRQTFIFEEDQKINCCKNQYSVLKRYDSVREHQLGVSYLPTIPFGSNNPESRIAFPTIPFGSINPESRIFLQFCSGASTRSLVSSYDSVREHQPGVSYFLMIPFGSINLESRILFSYDSIREMWQSLELKF